MPRESAVVTGNRVVVLGLSSRFSREKVKITEIVLRVECGGSSCRFKSVRKQERMAQILGSLHPRGRPGSSSWLWIGTALAVVAI